MPVSWPEVVVWEENAVLRSPFCLVRLPHRTRNCGVSCWRRQGTAEAMVTAVVASNACNLSQPAMRVVTIHIGSDHAFLFEKVGYGNRETTGHRRDLISRPVYHRCGPQPAMWAAMRGPQKRSRHQTTPRQETALKYRDPLLKMTLGHMGWTV
jgi:hypothetical protein